MENLSTRRWTTIPAPSVSYLVHESKKTFGSAVSASFLNLIYHGAGTVVHLLGRIITKLIVVSRVRFQSKDTVFFGSKKKGKKIVQSNELKLDTKIETLIRPKIGDQGRIPIFNFAFISREQQVKQVQCDQIGRFIALWATLHSLW